MAERSYRTGVVLIVIVAVSMLAILYYSRQEGVRAYKLAKIKVDPHAGHNHGPGEGHDDEPPAPAPAPSTGPVVLDKPDGWTEKPASGMRYKSYTIPGADGADADLSVIVLSGTGGGLMPNVNRWRGQLGLEPMSEEDFNAIKTQLTTGCGDALRMEFTGSPDKTNPEAVTRMIAAILPWNGRSWFFKLTGPDATVASAGEAFDQLVNSARPAEGGSE